MSGVARILFIATAMATLVAGFFYVLHGSNDAAPRVARVGGVEGAERSERDAADVDLIDVPGREDVMRAVASSADDSSPSAPLAEEASSLAGIVRLPATFPRESRDEELDVVVTARSLEPARAVAPVSGVVSANSRWRIDGLAPGAWLIVARAESEGRIATARTSEPIELLPGQARSGIRLALAEFAVTGTVTNSAGMPLGDVCVQYEWHGSRSQVAKPSSEFVPAVSEGMVVSYGSVIRVNAEAPGMFDTAGVRLSSKSDDSSTSESERDLENQKLRLALAEMARELKATNASRARRSPMRSLSFSLVDTSADESRWGPPKHIVRQVVTDRSGRFHIALEGPGRVELHTPAHTNEPSRNATEYLQETEKLAITIDAPNRSVDFVLYRPASVLGLLQSIDGTKDDISLFLRPARRSSKTQSTDQDGAFRYSGLRPGQYNFYARTGGSSGQDFSFASVFQLREGETKTINEVLVASSSFEGAVTDGSGQSVAGVKVTAIGADNSNLERTGTTDARGRFRIVGMYAGDYVLSVAGHTVQGDRSIFVAPRGLSTDVGALIVTRAIEGNESH